ncbi:hypothetical protein METBIDRAFT_33654 [Metschnikowia bicuspidata var. bicuspidata NRRL YB-4993]|uniref:Copper-fist domain-containing protein n=1 Tax=Metschnikowia bicuspidata var. bicuspidata NRRL YB-4993 TaxID=869754 RepID=A0A1A0H533_9ASCO|nr:hypothetical protein METBIDRAFT_33654 [Metschnikowia bicuspidata var. bicuspidata NRRL YB-4993]OBA19033.1 hypothetical protein METBIDRAFT_33654 [Metschnikowia bicuspidata var. bicuspidata NRRL YB-4993]
MILIDNVKYSCLECIRGHRSTLCRHHTRPLLQVRSKGRPNLLFPYGNKNYRIAVFAQEVDAGEKTQAQNCKTTPVVILKASNKHVIDVTNGQILGRYDDLQREKAQTPVIGPENFVVSSSCCSAAVSKVRKTCSCDQKKVLRLKILRSYITKKMLPDMHASQIPPLNSSNEANIPQDAQKLTATHSCSPHLDTQPTLKMEEKNTVPYMPRSCPSATTNFSERNSSRTMEQEVQYSFRAQGYDLMQLPQTLPTYLGSSSNDVSNKLQPQGLANANGSSDLSHLHDRNGILGEPGVFQVISVPSCSVLGSCGCSSDCSCASCSIHNPAAKTQDPLTFLNNDSQYGSNLLLKLEPPMDTGETYARELPRDLGQYSSYLAQLSGYDANPPPFLSELQMELQTALQGGSQYAPKQSLQSDLSPCSCPDDECFCRNCEKHGIIDGYKLDDIFGTVSNSHNGD